MPAGWGSGLTDAGLELGVSKPYATATLPADLDGFAALVVLGGDQHAYDDPNGNPGAPWFPALESLLRKAVRNKVPDARRVPRRSTARHSDGRDSGAQRVRAGDRSQAHRAPGRGRVRHRFGDTFLLLPDVLQWHHDEITELPVGATLLAASTRYSHQAFRMGDLGLGPAVPHRM